MTRRSYNQACGIARFLDVLGERWTLLVVRELLTGPRRFGEVLGRLPGISRNLLAERLRHLESAGIARRAGASARSRDAGWELTPKGRELGSVLMQIGEWGLRHTQDPTSRPAG